MKKSPTPGFKTFEGGENLYCDERYTFNHECKKLFWIEIDEGDECNNSAEEKAEEEQGEDKPEVFLNVLAGVMTP